MKASMVTFHVIRDRNVLTIYLLLDILLKFNFSRYDGIVCGKQLLLITMTFLLGLEMGFKLCTRTAIYILNPCHVTSMLQIYLLAAKPSKWTTTLFRIHVNYLNGPLLAFLFPEHDSRKITFELATYYIQHGLMFVIPAYLLRHGGPYAAEKIMDFSYSIAAYGIFIFYHYGILEFFAVTAQINLNHMICPAILDPFQGTNYRLIACMHQMILCPIISKSFGFVFSPSSTNTNETVLAEFPSNGEDHERNERKKNSLHQHKVEDIKSCQVQKMSRNIMDDMNNVLTLDNAVFKQALRNKYNVNNVNGRQIENDCNIDNSLLGGTSKQYPNVSNKKIQ
ncbi:transmembrane protein 164 isoform X2 [Contarinia nasturtii]|uniref:transmembrane protein 164 isoform X2 n=1 Tax=Contarinia nasturtii TaxID=265458 RepID=UPI0012D3774C|nr:transmembrane protein 164 isoform X2 [Contarinia nasturtii]